MVGYMAVWRSSLYCLRLCSKDNTFKLFRSTTSQSIEVIIGEVRKYTLKKTETKKITVYLFEWIENSWTAAIEVLKTAFNPKQDFSSSTHETFFWSSFPIMPLVSLYKSLFLKPELNITQRTYLRSRYTFKIIPTSTQSHSNLLRYVGSYFMVMETQRM